MSTRAQLRTRLRALVQEEIADQWSDAELDVLLNVALQKLELKILQIDPEAFVAKFDADIVDASSDPDRLWWYEWPAGTLYELAVKKKDAATGKFSDLDRRPLRIARSITSGGGLVYAHMAWDRPGFVLAPPPSTAQVAGLRVEVVPTLVMAADADIPPVPYPLHDLIPLLAAIDAMAETDEVSERLEAEVRKTLELLPLYYSKTNAVSDQIELDVSKGY